MRFGRNYTTEQESIDKLLLGMDNNLSVLDNHKTELAGKSFTGSSPVTWDVTLGTTLKLTITNSGSFTIQLASLDKLPAGNAIFIVDILNSSGGAMGTVTFSTTYFSLAGAFVAPANTKRRTIGFYYDGTKFIELFRSTADI